MQFHSQTVLLKRLAVLASSLSHASATATTEGSLVEFSGAAETASSVATAGERGGGESGEGGQGEEGEEGEGEGEGG